MAQDGDTITYSFSGSRVSEDISNIDEVEVVYCDGPGGAGNNFLSGGDGGLVENVTIDVGGENQLYVWVGESGYTTDNQEKAFGRYKGAESAIDSGGGAGSSEISFLSTDAADSSDEPFLVGAGGGAGGGNSGFFSAAGSGGARGGSGNANGEGDPPPTGGDGFTGAAGEPGDGAIDFRAIISGGSTSVGGGAAGGGPGDRGDNGEIKLSFKKTLSPPDPPSNLSAEVQ